MRLATLLSLGAAALVGAKPVLQRAAQEAFEGYVFAYFTNNTLAGRRSIWRRAMGIMR